MTLLAVAPFARAASAQPVDPYNPSAPAAPTPANGPASPAKGSASPAPPTSPAPARTPGRSGAAPQPAAPAPSASPAAPSPDPTAPRDPYAGVPSAGAPPAATQDPMLAERIAAALVLRAQELLDTEVYLDAKQLAVEALVQSPRGASADQAHRIIHAVNQKLGIPEDSPKPDAATRPEATARPEPKPTEDVDTSAIQDPTQATAPVSAPPEGGEPSTRIAASVHGGAFAGLLGATIGAFLSDGSPAAGAVPVGLAAGLGGALAVPRLVDRVGFNEAQVRTVGSATVWGGMIGGLFGDIYRLHGTTAREVLVGGTIGSTVAGAAGAAFAMNNQLTRGDVALVDTLAGLGGLGGFTVGMVMQPAQREAYSLNAVIGITTGVVVGLVEAPRTNTTQRRMVRVAGISLIGGAAPFLLYAAIHDPRSQIDERVTGVLSTAGLVGGAYLGLRWTDGMDDGLDTLDGKRHKAIDDAPVALVGRSSAGRWGMGGLGLQPLSPVLSPQPGLALQLVGATF